MAELPAPRHRRAALVNLASHYVNLALTVVQGLVLVPLYLRHIPTALFGAWLATGNILAWIELVDPGVSSVLQQRVAFTLGQRDKSKLGVIIGTGLALSFGVALLPLPLVLGAGHLAKLVGYVGIGSEDLTMAFRVALASTAASLASFGVTAVNVGLQQAVASGGIFIVAGVVGMGVTVVGLLLGLGLVALPLGLLVRSSIVLVGNIAWLAGWCRKHIRGEVSIRRQALRELLAPIGVTAVSRLGVTLVTRLDAFVVSRMLGPEAVVPLALTGKALEVVRLALDRIGAALMPGVAHLAGEARLSRATTVVHTAAGIIGALGSAGIGATVALNGRFVSLWVGPDHFGGVALTATMGIATGVMVLVSVMGNFAFALGGVREVARLSLVEAAIRLPALLAFTAASGLYGVPGAAILASLVVSTTALPGVIAGLVGHDTGTLRRVWVAALLKIAAGVGVGVAAGSVVDAIGPASTWPVFVALAGGVGVAALLVAVGTEKTLRQGAWAWLGGRLGWARGD